jgi:hypothetical protein
MHGAQVNVTDGRHVYMRAAADAENQSLFNYTLMPTAMRGFIRDDLLSRAELQPPFTFTRGCPTLKIPSEGWVSARGEVLHTRLWDVESDPKQTQPIDDAALEATMAGHLTRLMRECDAPPEQFARLGLEPA